MGVARVLPVPGWEKGTLPGMDNTFRDSELGEVEWLRENPVREAGAAFVTWGAVVLFCFAPALAFLLIRALG